MSAGAEVGVVPLAAAGIAVVAVSVLVVPLAAIPVLVDRAVGRVGAPWTDITTREIQISLSQESMCQTRIETVILLCASGVENVLLMPP